MKLTALLVLAFFIAPVLAQETAPEMPVVSKTAGQPVKAVWLNGNEAEFKFSRSVNTSVPVDYQVTENLCSGTNGDIMKMVFPYRIDRMGWFWSKHSDPAKVGAMLKAKLGTISFDLFRFTVVTNGLQFTQPSLVSGPLALAEDELHFTGLNWLPGFSNNTLSPFVIDGWMSEVMLMNSQTGLMENRIASGAYGVHLQPTGNLTAKISSIDSGFYLPILGGTFVFIGDVVSWQWRNSSGSCQIAFKPNIGPANTAVIAFLGGLRDPFIPYLWEQDALTETVEPEFLKDTLRYVEQ